MKKHITNTHSLIKKIRKLAFAPISYNLLHTSETITEIRRLLEKEHKQCKKN